MWFSGSHVQVLAVTVQTQREDMDEIWTLIVSLGAMWSAPAVSAQDSSR